VAVAEFRFRLSCLPRAMSHTACRRAPRSVRHGDGAALRCRYGSGGRWGKPGKVPVGSCRRAIVGWLSPIARPAARIEPSRATARNTRTSPQSIAPRPGRGGWVAGSCRVSRANPLRAAMTCSCIARLNVSTQTMLRSIKIERHEIVAAFNKNGDHCKQIVPLRFHQHARQTFFEIKAAPEGGHTP